MKLETQDIPINSDETITYQMKNGNDINKNKEKNVTKKKDKKKKHKEHKKEKHKNKSNHNIKVKEDYDSSSEVENEMNDPTKEKIEQSTAQSFDDGNGSREDDGDGNKNTKSKKKSEKEEKEQKKKLEKKEKRDAKKLKKRQKKNAKKLKKQLKKEAKNLMKKLKKEKKKERKHLKKEEKKKRKERDDNMTTDIDVVNNRPKRQRLLEHNDNKSEQVSKNNSLKDTPDIIEETDAICTTYRGLIIGKGGQMIRDLQARSGCHIQFNQNVPTGVTCPLTYRGTRQRVKFAKRLVSLLCIERREADLPLGELTRKHLVVSADVLGLIIGRGGKVIQELRRKSQAKIDVDHTGAEFAYSSQRQVTITGTEQNVLKAEEMINFLTSHPRMNSMQALGMLIEDEWKHIESEIFPCPERYIGRVMGIRGSRMINLKNKSGCDIQINQDVPTGHDFQIILKGTRQRIEITKKMLREFIEMCPSHADAGEYDCLEHKESEIFPWQNIYLQ